MIFVDSGAFIARHLKRDQFHVAATEVWNQLAASGEPVCTSNFVVDEAVTFLARRAGHAVAATIARQIYSSAELLILRPTVADELAALEWFEKFADQHVSFTDCVSFVLMQRNGLTRVFTFDQHFTRAGFDAVP